VQRGFYFHTSGEDLPPEVPERKSHSAALVLERRNWKNRNKR
jgi:hypothetical protein